jgi:hypothetical protein
VIYKKKIICLSSLIAVLALLYTGSLVFNPERNNNKNASYTWLDPKLAGKADRIVINTEKQKLELIKKKDGWFVLHNGSEYPALWLRIEDFISIFTTRSAWPVRTSSASSHARFGLEDGVSSRLTVYGENSVYLDIEFGDNDKGREVFVRRFAGNEVRSGDNTFISYIDGTAASWYNLRFFPEIEDGKISLEDVQRLSLYNEGEAVIFTRANRSWEVSGANIANPDIKNIENYISTVLNSEGDDFLDSISPNDPALNHSRIVIEFGNGRISTIRISAADEVNRRFAHVSGSDYIYAIPLWVSMRVLKNAASFETQ